MKSIISVLVITMFIFTNNLLAAQNSKQMSDKNEVNELKQKVLTLENQVLKNKVKKYKKGYRRYNSRIHRQDKIFTFHGDVGGKYNFIGLGLTAGFFITPNVVIELSYFTDNDDEDTSTYTSSYTSYTYVQEEKISALSLDTKIFVGNSFYVKPGVYYYGYEYIDNDPKLSSKYNLSNSHESAGIQFSIGNQWQWKYFTLGVDWIGFSHEIGRYNESRNYLGSLYEDDDTKLNFVTFYLGASF